MREAKQMEVARFNNYIDANCSKCNGDAGEGLLHL